MTNKKTIAVLTDNIAGAILSVALETLGYEVYLVSTQNNFLNENSYNELGLSYAPSGEPSEFLIKKFKELTGVEFEYTAVDLPPLTFSDNELKSFVGFGDSAFSTAPLLSYFNQSQYFLLNPSVASIANQFRSRLKAKVINANDVSPVALDSRILKRLTINATQEIIADQYFFLLSPESLAKILPEDTLSARHRSRINKTPTFAKIVFHVKHPLPVTAHKNMIFLLPNQTDQYPVVGQFFEQNNQHTSVWQTYFPNEISADLDSVASIIKASKKMIHKAFPLLSEKLNENISISFAMAGDFTWLTNLPEIKNFAENCLISTPLASSQNGLMRRIDCALSTLNLFHSFNCPAPHAHATSMTL